MIQFLVVICRNQGRRLDNTVQAHRSSSARSPATRQAFYESEEAAQRYSAAAAEHDWRLKLGGA
jgi:hypothetical protein